MGDVYGHLYSGNTPSRKNSANFGGDTPWIRTADLNNGLIKSTTEFLTYEGIKQLKILPENTIVLAMYGGFNQIGRTGILGFPATINQALVALTPHKNINQFFAQSYLNRHIIDWRRVAASSRKDPNITKEDVEKSEFSFGSLEEQNRISKLISRLDHTITLHEEKKRQLERLKSALLKKMFADKDSYPSVRFSNFGDNWKQYKLSDIGEIITGSTPPRQHPEYYSNNGVLWVTPTDITENLISDTAKKLSVSGTRAGQVVPAGSILVTCIASIGKNALLLTEGSFNQQINCIVPNSNKFDSYFLLTESFHWLDPMRRIAGAGTMQIVNKHSFSEIHTFIPKLEEQIVIGNIFSKLDSLIALYKQKLEKINILKQWLLQNMFI